MTPNEADIYHGGAYDALCGIGMSPIEANERATRLAEEYRRMMWITRNEDAGQTVEVSYRCDGEAIHRRTVDRAEGSVEYHRATLAPGASPITSPTGGEPEIEDWEQYLDADDDRCWPTAADVSQRLESIREFLEPCEECEPSDDSLGACDDHCRAQTDVRLQVYPDGAWMVRYGSADYDQDHRGYWGSSFVWLHDDATTLRDSAAHMIDEAREQCAMDG